MTDPVIRRLRAHEAEAYVRFRRASLEDAPLAFASSPDHDFMGRADRVAEELGRGDDSAIFGAFAPDLRGVAGVFRDPRPKVRHKMFVWGVYVAPGARGRGLGGRLLEAVVEHGRACDGVLGLYLGVTEASPAARRLYERAGFREWGAEPAGLCYRGVCVTEHHFHLDLGGDR